MSACGVFRGWVFLLLLQTYRGCSIPTAKLTSNPAEYWAWILGRESQSLDLTRVFILIMFPFILFCFCFFCHGLFYPQSCIRPGQFMPSSITKLCFSLSYYYYYFFFTVGLASLREERESFQLCPRLNLLCASAAPTEVVGWCAAFDTQEKLPAVNGELLLAPSDGAAPERPFLPASWMMSVGSQGLHST